MSQHQILNPADHGTLRVHTGPGAQYGDDTMACLTVPAEFRRVQGHFPIVFRRDLATGQFSALALFGFEPGENLFLEEGHWDAPYRPLALSIQPFLVGRPGPGGGEGQVHIDMAHPRVSTSGEGTRLFDDEGRPTPHVEAVAGMLGDLDHAHREGASFFAALERHDLLEPFSLEVALDDGSQHSLVGFHTIDEVRLAALAGPALQELHATGDLLRIHLAMASLSQFAGLVARRNARIRAR
ncbi:SapC family protein [Novosphingobium sp.]|uniref:SapC family protein n=1 Tax=Novosphingobium sp. TaxID=1874826 RepID=UPI0026334913|nr:SapC family protein [Novosphingobium sp.]